MGRTKAETQLKSRGSRSHENLLSLYLASHTSPRHLPSPTGFCDILLRNELDEFYSHQREVEYLV